MSDEKSGKVGKPTLYKTEYCAEIIKYFSRNPYDEVTRDVVTKSGDVISVSKPEATDFPTFAGFAASIQVTRGTLLDWCKAHEDFDWAYARCKDLQENWYVINGNRGHLQANFAIFTGKNVFGWRDKQPDETDSVNINLTLAERIASARKRAKEGQE